MKRFVFFHGYQELHPLLDIDWDAINRLSNLPTILNPITTLPVLPGTTNTPTWIVNPGLIQYTPNFITTTNPNYNITTTPNTGGYMTIHANGTGLSGTATGFSLTTSNSNGTTYTTGTLGGPLTTGTATFRSGAFTSKFM